MANPQLEDGHIRMATPIWDQLCKIRISGEARQILDFIIRKTYGWNKKSDIIALSQFVEGTGIRKQHVIRSTEKLKKMNLIIVTKKGNAVVPTYCFNKDYDKWKPLPKKVTLKTVTKKGNGVTKKGYKSVPKKGPTITNKATIQKIGGVSFCKEHPNSDKIVQFFLKTLDEDSRYRPQTEAQKLKWLECAQWAINHMGKYGDEKVIDIIEYFRNPDNTDNGKFNWADNFRSILKLKKKNKEDVYYLDYFWEELNNKECLEYGNQKVQSDPSTDSR